MAAQHSAENSSDDSKSSSAATSPDHSANKATASPESRFTTSRPRSTSEVTITSGASVYSTPSLIYPGAPINSPENSSVFGGGNDDTSSSLDADSLADKLKHMPASPAVSNPFHHHNHITNKTPSQSLGEAGFKSSTGTYTPTKLSKVTSAASDEVSEYNLWGHVAEEDVATGLQRLAMLAKDEHKKDGSKTVEQYYTEHLTRLILDAEVEFDCSKLHQ